MMLLLNTLTTVCIGLLIGTEFAVSAFINPVLWKLEERRRHERSVYLQPNWGRSCLFGIARSRACACRNGCPRQGPGKPLLVTASVIWAAVIALTVWFLVPINKRMTSLADSVPEEARRSRKRWDTLHRLRIVALMVAMICFLVGGTV